jgi:hypothetical protein
VRDEIRERMRLGGIEAVVGSTNFHERVTDGVRAWLKRESLDTSGAMPTDDPHPPAQSHHPTG